MSSFGRAAEPSTNIDLRADAKLMSSPEDTITSLSWSSKADFLAASSCDQRLRIYDMTSNPTGEGRAIIDFDGPVLSCDWSVLSRNSHLGHRARILIDSRTAQKLLEQARIKLLGYWILL
jgi:WD40 repeat protein